MAARLHIIVPTHTPRHLAACLGALAHQVQGPRSITVTCDTDLAEIGQIVRTAPRHADLVALTWVHRASPGVVRLNQLRNNALRAIDPPDDDLVVVIDGDIVLEREALARHASLADRGARMVHAFRVDLSPDASRAAERALEGSGADLGALIGAGDRERLARRARRYRRHAFARRLGFPLAGHKPKLLGAHHAVRAGLLRSVNGYDEAYEGYGFDDDDLARRLHRAGARGVIAVEEILALHLYHESRAPARAVDAPGYARFRRRDLPVRCEHGWQDPLAQPGVTIERIFTRAGTGRR